MTTLTLYTHPQSRGVTAQIMLAECEADYTTVIIDYEKIKDPDYLSINPMGKLPALTDGDTVITELAAICTYLADKYPHKSLAPASDSVQRGVYYRWLFFACNVLEPAMMVKLGRLSEAQYGHVGFGKLEEAIAILEDTLAKQPYLCGEEYTTADVYVGAMLIWAKMQQAVSSYPAVIEIYLKTMTSRPAAQQVLSKSIFDNQLNRP